MKVLNSLLCIFVLVPENCFTYTLQSDCRHFKISNLLICFNKLSPKTMNDFCLFLSLFFLMTFLFSDFGFILSLLFDISASILLDFYIAKSLLDVSIMVVFKSVLLDVSVLCESLCFTGVARASARACVCEALTALILFQSFSRHTRNVNLLKKDFKSAGLLI